MVALATIYKICQNLFEGILSPKNNQVKKRPRIDNQIRVPVIDVIDQNGTYHKNISTSAGMQMAQMSGLNLVEINPMHTPPMCKIMDYGKFCYEESKKSSAARKKQKEILIKEFRISPNIGQRDLEIKIKHAKETLQDGNKVRIVLIYERREILHKDLGLEAIKKFTDALSDLGKIGAEPELMGRKCICIVQPK